jgi:succinate dehydrogenase/fumarate reductase flavoprotein subunit
VGETRCEVDLVVLGSGAAGLTAALTGCLLGLRVLVLEHCSVVGGTSARSSGTIWIPGNHYLPAGKAAADSEQAAHYLASLVGNRGEERIWRRFLDIAPRMLAELDTEAGIAFRPYVTAPDYRQDHPGAAAGGRPLEPMPFDGRTLGSDFATVAAPLPELVLFGGLMITRGEAATLLRFDRSISAAWLGLKLVARYLLDRLRYPRGTRLVLGNALVARLFKAVKDRGGEVWTDATCCELIRKDDRIAGVEVSRAGRNITVHALRGVVLAGGGFPGSAEKRNEHLPQLAAQYTPTFEGADGSTIDLGITAGGVLGESGLDNALWFPSSVAKRRDGSTAVYPHIVLDRAKPGLIAVNAAGRRFVNEAVSYHDFVRGMYRANAETPSIPAWLICDRAFIHKYGLGLIRPRTPSLRRYVQSGYVREAPSIAALAAELNLPVVALEATVAQMNAFAASGVDTQFHRGESIYDRNNGDATQKPNPCLGPIRVAPFYAVPVLPTPLGTSRGLRADDQARVCDTNGAPIPGLYVCGNDMQSVFGGEYPGAGGQIGPGMTFGWIAARHAAGAAA